MKMKSVTDVFDRARKARVAVVGIGSILSGDSSYYDLHPTSRGDRKGIERAGAAGELLAHLIDGDGNLCDYELNARLVAMSPQELDAIPMTIGVAAGANKVAPDLRRAQRPASQGVGARRSDRQRRPRNDGQMNVNRDATRHADARDRTRPASAPRSSASAPGRSADGCGAAPTRRRRSPRSGLRSTPASR